ncbi:MAG: hypothetical protein NZ571_02470, partial [Anaerolineae bacterium]|nr:hypothetical protein [Anaerolineae bacterium]
WNIGDVYKAIGRPDILWKTTLVEFLILAPTLFILAQQSALAVAVGHLCVAIVVSTLRLLIASHILKIAFLSALRQFMPSLIGSALMSSVVWSALNIMLPLIEAGVGLLVMIAAVILGMTAYVATLWWLERDLVRRGISMALRLVQR